MRTKESEKARWTRCNYYYIWCAWRSVEISFKEDCNLVVEIDANLKWIVDSGACYSITPRRDIIFVYKLGKIDSVKINDTDYTDIIGFKKVRV